MVLIEICWYWLSQVFISTVLVGKIIIWSTGIILQYGFCCTVAPLIFRDRLSKIYNFTV